MLVVFLCLLFNFSILNSGAQHAAMSLLPFNACAITTAYSGNPVQNQDFILLMFTDVTGNGWHANLKTFGYQSTGGRFYWTGRRWDVSTLHPATGQYRDLALPM